MHSGPIGRQRGSEDTNLNSNAHFDSCGSKLTKRLSNEGTRGGEDRSEHEEERRMESIARPDRGDGRVGGP